MRPLRNERRAKTTSLVRLGLMARRVAFWLLCYGGHSPQLEGAPGLSHPGDGGGRSGAAWHRGQSPPRGIGANPRRLCAGGRGLYNAHIDEYAFGNRQNHAPKTVRKLLLHKSEIRRLAELTSVKGHTLIPLSFYWKNGKIKVALGVGQGKATFDKREDLKKRESDRELKRVMMHRAKRG